MDDNFPDTPDYILKAKLPSNTERRFPPRVRQLPPPEGEDYFTLTQQHGRPFGAFEHGRERQYRG